MTAPITRVVARGTGYREGMDPHRRSSQPLGVAIVRKWLPVVLVIAAAIVLLVGPRGLAPGLLATAMFVIVADWIIRFAISSQYDRDAEASARRRFARSGHWPDEPDGEDEAADEDDAARHRHDAPHRTGGTNGADAEGRPPSRRARRRR